MSAGKKGHHRRNGAGHQIAKELKKRTGSTCGGKRGVSNLKINPSCRGERFLRRLKGLRPGRGGIQCFDRRRQKPNRLTEKGRESEPEPVWVFSGGASHPHPAFAKLPRLKGRGAQVEESYPLERKKRSFEQQWGRLEWYLFQRRLKAT